MFEGTVVLYEVQFFQDGPLRGRYPHGEPATVERRSTIIREREKQPESSMEKRDRPLTHGEPPGEILPAVADKRYASSCAQWDEVGASLQLQRTHRRHMHGKAEL